jgi:steroid Delta-isomerase
MTSPRHPDPRLARVIAFYEGLNPTDLDRLDAVYTPDVRFKDPFNEVQGVPAIRDIFEHMYRSLRSPRFIILDAVGEGEQAFVTWEFRFHFLRFNADEQVVRGATHLRFAADGRLQLHRDYWDAAEELYEKLPAIGSLMRWLKRQARS